MNMGPSLSTDAYEDDTPRDVPLVFLAGPIKFGWTCWGSPAHEAYLEHRAGVRALIDAGYLTYAPWDALKGTWTVRAQAIDDAAIAAADIMLVLTPPGVPAEGTAVEIDHAARVGTPVVEVLPATSRVALLEHVAFVVGPGQPSERVWA